MSAVLSPSAHQLLAELAAGIDTLDRFEAAAIDLARANGSPREIDAACSLLDRHTLGLLALVRMLVAEAGFNSPAPVIINDAVTYH